MKKGKLFQYDRKTQMSAIDILYMTSDFSQKTLNIISRICYLNDMTLGNIKKILNIISGKLIELNNLNLIKQFIMSLVIKPEFKFKKIEHVEFISWECEKERITVAKNLSDKFNLSEFNNEIISILKEYEKLSVKEISRITDLEKFRELNNLLNFIHENEQVLREIKISDLYLKYILMLFNNFELNENNLLKNQQTTITEQLNIKYSFDGLWPIRKHIQKQVHLKEIIDIIIFNKLQKHSLCLILYLCEISVDIIQFKNEIYSLLFIYSDDSDDIIKKDLIQLIKNKLIEIECRQ